MIREPFMRYLNNFKGFSREIWILAIVTFVNRAGTMVLPFLSKYLKENLHFSLGQVGWILASFGFGSLVGSYLGGKLSDKIGFYKVMLFSMLGSGLAFFVVQHISSFSGLCIAFFLIMTIADMFRPAMFVSISAYAKPENQVRSFTLVRLAVNLGFAAGPALGGLIIMSIGYKGLFWADGGTCIISILAFALLVKEKRKSTAGSADIAIDPQHKISKDRIYRIFLFVSFLTAMVFFQLFTTVPLYCHDGYGLSEFETGLLMTLNGLLVFLFEMPIVGYFERKKTDRLKIIVAGAIILGAGYFFLLPEGWISLLIVYVICMSFGEMLLFPFTNAFAVNRAPEGYKGRYMALFTMSFSLAHIGSAKIGMEITSYFGYAANWMFMGILSVIGAIATLYLRKEVQEEGKI